MDYSVHMHTRSEYERTNRSLRPVPEFGSHVIEHKTGEPRRLLLALRPILAAILNVLPR